MAPAFAFDPTDPAFVADPYPTYERLRAEAPVLLHEPSGLRFVSRFADVGAALRDRRFGRAFAPREPLEAMRPFNLLNERSLFDAEPPVHTRLRGLVSKVFTPRRVEALRPVVREMAEERVRAGVHDIVADLAEPIPVAVIAELLGVPEPDRHRLRPWSRAIVAMYELEPGGEVAREAVRASVEFRDSLLALASARRRAPGEDLLSGLVEVGLSDDELVATCVLLLNAGHEATVNAIGNGVLALLGHRREWERLIENPSLVPGAVEELLRFDTPLQLFQRTAFVDAEVGGIEVRRGERVALLLGSANRDPEAFPDPDRLDVTRSPNPHLGFGARDPLLPGGAARPRRAPGAARGADPPRAPARARRRAGAKARPRDPRARAARRVGLRRISPRASSATGRGRSAPRSPPSAAGRARPSSRAR